MLVLDAVPLVLEVVSLLKVGDWRQLLIECVFFADEDSECVHYDDEDADVYCFIHGNYIIYWL